MVHQRKSTLSRTVEQQLPLLSPLPSKPSAQPDLGYLLALPTLRRVIRYSMSLRDLEPKQVYEQLDMDKATWSRIENGGMSFPADDLEDFRQIVGNDAVILWLLHQSGFDVTSVRRQQSDLEARVELAEQRARDAEYRLSVAVELMAARPR